MMKIKALLAATAFAGGLAASHGFAAGDAIKTNDQATTPAAVTPPANEAATTDYTNQPTTIDPSNDPLMDPAADSMTAPTGVPSTADTPAITTDPMMDDHTPTILGATQIRQVQQALTNAGFPAGRADGIMGPRTEGALRDFQAARALSPTGEADRETLQALGVSVQGLAE